MDENLYPVDENRNFWNCSI